MIPIVLLALGLGVALAAYELSPSVHTRVDAYARAIRAANSAHAEADGHMNNVNAATDVAEHHAARAQQPPRPAPSPVQPRPPVVAPPPPPPPSIPVPTPVPTPAPPTPVPTPPTPTSVVPPAETVPVPADTTTADAHADAAQSAANAAVDHAAAATDANREAAKQTADAAANAKTQADRQAAAQSAQKVLEREKKIADALARLGIGKCGVHVYSNITTARRDMLITRLRGAGMTVTGDNPWDIDTNMSGVTLRAVWDPKKAALRLIINDWGPLASLAGCDTVWGKIDTRLKEVLGT